MRNRQRLCHGKHPGCSKEYDSVKSLTRHENTNLQTWKPNANILAGNPHTRIHSNDVNEVLGRSRGRFWIIGIVLALLPMYSKAAFAATVVGGMNARWGLRGDLIEIKYPLITYGKRACGDYSEECDHIPHEDLLGRLLLADLLAVKHGAISEKGFWSVSLTSSAGIARTLGLLVQLRNPMCWRDELNMWTFWRVAAYLEVLSKSFVMPKVRDKTIYHGMRLLSGYYRIIHTWSHLYSHPLQFDLPLLLVQIDINLVVRNHLQSSGKIKTRQRLW